mgnify:CR=1 FL=1
MKKNSHTILLQQAIEYVQHAHALISYAETDTAFAESLAWYIQSQEWPMAGRSESISSIYIAPSDQAAAVRSTHWLMLQLDSQPEAYVARGELATWADQFAQPKNLVLGIVGLAIIGPTLGLIENKKKKKSKMKLIVKKDWASSLTTAKLVEKTQSISQQMVAKELRSARGKLENLHPDTADWCMAGSDTKLYQTDQADINLLYSVVSEDRLQHVCIREKGTIVALAISPSVNDQITEDTLS